MHRAAHEVYVGHRVLRHEIGFSGEELHKIGHYLEVTVGAEVLDGRLEKIEVVL